jgi:hypothetical protein
MFDDLPLDDGFHASPTQRELHVPVQRHRAADDRSAFGVERRDAGP